MVSLDPSHARRGGVWTIKAVIFSISRVFGLLRVGSFLPKALYIPARNRIDAVGRLQTILDRRQLRKFGSN